MLMVGTIAGVMLATVLNNGGGAWDNAKKYIESGQLKDDDGNVLGKGSRCARRGRRRRHGRRSVQGHRRPVAPRPGEAARHHHPGARAALHPRSATPVDVVLQAALIGLLQGLTEFIPVSSSRAPRARAVDRRLGVRWADRQPGLRRLPAPRHAGGAARLLRAGLACATSARGWRASRERRIGADPDRRIAWLLVLGHRSRRRSSASRCEGLIEDAFHGDNDDVAAGDRRLPGHRRGGAVAAPIGSGAAAGSSTAVDRADGAGDRPVSQALALLPGISRSGATITTGLALGLTREAAARFSFLLATPITLGAGLYGSRRLLTESAHRDRVAGASGSASPSPPSPGWWRSASCCRGCGRRSVTVFSVYRRRVRRPSIVVLVVAGR